MCNAGQCIWLQSNEDTRNGHPTSIITHTLHVIGRIDARDVMNAGSSFVLLVHAVQPNEVFLRMTSYLRTRDGVET